MADLSTAFFSNVAPQIEGPSEYLIFLFTCSVQMGLLVRSSLNRFKMTGLPQMSMCCVLSPNPVPFDASEFPESRGFNGKPSGFHGPISCGMCANGPNGVHLLEIVRPVCKGVPGR